MAVLSPSVRLQVASRLRPMQEKVTLLVVHRENAPDPQEKENSEVLRSLAQEVASISDYLEYRALDASDPEAAALGLARYPALVLLDGEGRHRGVVFSGMVGGYEFSVLLEDILDLGAKRALLSPATAEKVAAIREPVHIMVFSTPT